MTQMLRELKWKTTRVYHLFRYDIPAFVKNLWVFRRTLWNSRSWDYTGVLHALRDQLTRMEPAIRYGSSTKAERVADKVKLCLLLLDRELTDYDNGFDKMDIDMEGNRWKLTRTPQYSEAPRHTRYQSKIIQSRDKLQFELLMTTLSKHLKSMWD